MMQHWLLFLTCLLTLAPSLHSAPQVRQEEEQDYYRKWLEENVIYIIGDEERSVFEKLTTDDERDQFIEQFWRRRDPNPDTAINEFREEHYRRIQYANERFHTGVDGWRTDRGMIYIKFGPPTSTENYPSGGHYNRPSWEGGGSTSTYPFEIWRYRYLEGIGQDIEIEFVDPTLSGEYHIATNRWEKDALLYAGSAGETLMEQLGLSSKIDRIVPKTNPMPGHNPLGFGYGRLKDQPFERQRLLTDLQRAPEVDRSRLSQFVSAEVQYEDVPFEVRSDYLRIAEQDYLVALTFLIQNRDLQYSGQDNLHLATISLYGEIVDLAGRIVQRFDRVVASRVPKGQLREELNRPSLFQEQLHLKPGRYLARLALEDQTSGNIGTDVHLIVVPRIQDGILSTSSIVPAFSIEVLEEAGGNQFVMGPGRVFPNPSAVLKPGEPLPLFFQVYNVAVEQARQVSQLDVDYVIKRESGEVFRALDEIGDLVGPEISVAKILPIGHLTPGDYQLTIQVFDRITQEKVVQQLPFTITG